MDEGKEYVWCKTTHQHEFVCIFWVRYRFERWTNVSKFSRKFVVLFMMAISVNQVKQTMQIFGMLSILCYATLLYARTSSNGSIYQMAYTLISLHVVLFSQTTAAVDFNSLFGRSICIWDELQRRHSILLYKLYLFFLKFKITVPCKWCAWSVECTLYLTLSSFEMVNKFQSSCSSQNWCSTIF